MADHKWKLAYVGLGSNMGDREHYLLNAIEMLGRVEEIRVAQCSHIYETVPVGYLDQALFLNMVIRLETTLQPQALLTKLLEVEQAFGRLRDQRWGPRTLDLDLLLFGDETLDTPDLIIPHPRMHERAFVMVPLADVWIRNVKESKIANLEKDDIKLWKTVDCL